MLATLVKKSRLPWAIPLLALLAVAQSSASMNLEQAVARALDVSPDVKSAQASIEAAQARLRQARSGYYPQINNSGLAKAGLSGALNGLQPVGLPNSPFHRNFADAINFYHPGLDFGRTKHSVGIARRRIEALQADLEATQASVALDTVVLFYEVIRTKRTLHAALKSVVGRELTVRQARAFYEVRFARKSTSPSRRRISPRRA